MKKENPYAVVLGDIDLLHPLGAARIPCAVAAKPGALPRFSRYAKVVLDWADPSEQPEKLLQILTDFAARQNSKPVLFYEWDSDLLFVSRYRKNLRPFFDFVIPDAVLVENLVDKSRFHLLADLLSLPVPATTILSAGDSAEDLGLNFPVILKPVTRKKKNGCRLPD